MWPSESEIAVLYFSTEVGAVQSDKGVVAVVAIGKGGGDVASLRELARNIPLVVAAPEIERERERFRGTKDDKRIR